MSARRVLILGGTAEAAALARLLDRRPGVAVVYSLAGRTRAPATVAARTRHGGFGGVAGLARYLSGEGVTHVVDATHPYAAQISRHAAAACDERGVPRIALVRPAWERRAGDRWIEVGDAHAAARAAAALGGRVLLTIGSSDLGAFASVDGVDFLVRAVEPPSPALPPERFRVLLARGPFAAADEAALLARERIGAVVSKNSGGDATYGKIAAARGAGLPVIMIARPPAPPGPHAGDAGAVVDWLEGGGRGVR